MEDSLKSGPFIVVESKVYFDWLSLRLQALKQVQIKMAQRGPSNFGISTCIMMHLLRHTVHSPVSDTPWLTAALRELRFQENMDTFGMFFLHDLDTNLWCLGGIEANDPEPCEKYFTQTKKKTKVLNRFETKAPEPPNTEASPEYPCGESPDYATWQRTLLNSDDPASMVMEWVMEDDFNHSVDPLAINLFIAFTMDLIHAITLDYIKGGYPEKPESLEEAMEFWTVESLAGLLHYPEFISTNWSLKGTIMGPRDQDPKHLNLFFPESDDTLKDSGWDAVLRWGYLKSFFAQKRRMPRDDFIDLKQDLGRIFNRLQCLPVAGVPKGCYKGSIWVEGKKEFQIRVNPNHYCLKKTLVVKVSGRSRKKKGLKSIPQQAKDFADIRGSDREVSHGSKGMLKAKTNKYLHMDFDHFDSDDGNCLSHEDTLKKARESSGSKTDSDIEEYLPPKKTLTVKKAPADVKKVVQRDRMSVKDEKQEGATK